MKKNNDWFAVDLRSFFATMLFFSVLAGVGLYAMYTTDVSSFQRSRRLSESIQNDMASMSITRDLQDLFVDLQLLSSHVELRRFMTTNSSTSRRDVEREFFSLCKISQKYDQVRILNNDGMELVRVNYNDGNPAVVPQDKLQNKSSRYYFKEAINLPPGKFYVSPFDLNMEHGEIEVPFKPMIRVCAPIEGYDGKRLGIIILNYLGQHMLSNIAKEQSGTMQSQLLNSDGYWLFSPDKSREWGFMFNDRKEVSFASLYPDEWKTIKASASGQFASPSGEYTFSTLEIPPRKSLSTQATLREWKVVCFTPRSVIAASSFTIFTGYLSLFLGIFIIILFGSFTRARYVRSREKGRQKLEQARLEAENANNAKSEFLARMSHEIRTPMNAIIGLTHLALKTDLTAKQLDYLTKVSLAASSLLSIINDILDFSKIEANRFDLEKIDFLLDDVINNTAHILGVQAEDKGLELLLKVRSSVPNLLVGDPLRLGQVLLNLVGNAIKFTESGEVIISADLVEETATKATIRFSVHDTGIGISEEQGAALFQPFMQADGSISRKFGGTGLGLAISKRIVEKMGGTMQLKSEQGKGSEFSFTIPFELQSGHTEHYRATPNELQGMRVLVVDGSEKSRFVLGYILESFSFVVRDTPSGDTALQWLREHDADDPFKLVITDWRMEDMDGIELTRRIKESEQLKHPPHVIMLTANGYQETRHRMEWARLDGFMLKPFNRSILFDTIMNIFCGGSCTSRLAGSATMDFDIPPNVSGARVLIAEDNAINQQVAKEILEHAGVSVHIANNGKEALTMLAQENYDVVFLDIQMPEMDGIQTTKEIRSDPKFQNLPVIAMTAHALTGDREKSLAAGMNAHVTKPIDPRQLIEVLSSWLPEFEEGKDFPTKASSSKGSGKTSFPQLSGVDIRKGLGRLGGNEALYGRLLGSFASDCGNEWAHLKMMISRGDYTNAYTAAHSLKSIAGNLGADGLYEMLRQIEYDMRDKRPVPQLFLERFDAELALVRNSILAAFPSSAVTTSSDSAPCTAKACVLRPQLAELADLLKQHDLEARNMFYDLQPALKDILPGFEAELAFLLAKFDYPASHEKVISFLRGCDELEDHNP
ncbi:MAG: response regulator [Desulfovibrio sp.]|uniref:response regulator n=1 Tax=Desulfovibrio sp. 7SRBS1 TaxID=3378064 RepID=UPI003B3E87C7